MNELSLQHPTQTTPDCYLQARAHRGGSRACRLRPPPPRASALAMGGHRRPPARVLEPAAALRSLLPSVAHGKGSARMAALDGVRALALVWVLAYHVLVYRLVADADLAAEMDAPAPASAVGPWLNSWATQPVQSGHMGVDVFMVLSGFLLATLYAQEVCKSGAFRCALQRPAHACQLGNWGQSAACLLSSLPRLHTSSALPSLLTPSAPSPTLPRPPQVRALHGAPFPAPVARAGGGAGHQHAGGGHGGQRRALGVPCALVARAAHAEQPAAYRLHAGHDMVGAH